MVDVPTLSWVPDAVSPAEYADVSRDRSGIHLDEDLARRQGLPGVILHGMHVFGQVVSHLDRMSPSGTVWSVSCRFVDVSLPGTQIDVQFFELEEGLVFSAKQGGRLVLAAGTAKAKSTGDGMPVAPASAGRS